MPDLTKLTARELLKYPRGTDEDGNAYVIPSYTPQTIAEIRRRLEHLEKCETALKLYADGKHWVGEMWDGPGAGTDAARAALAE